jgi:hypothetical protein
MHKSAAITLDYKYMSMWKTLEEECGQVIKLVKRGLHIVYLSA